MPQPELRTLLARIAQALDRLTPAGATRVPDGASAYVWHADRLALLPVAKVNRIDLDLLVGVDRQRDILLANTRQFARGLPANNALLWGARGAGKSSLVKAVHACVAAESGNRLALVEIHREDIESLPHLLACLRDSTRRFLVYCDDLSFENADTSYKSLKAMLEGGIEGRPDNVVFYATSNRRHLMSRSISENEQASAIHPGEAAEEKISLSDRFGLWIGFHAIDQETYLAMIDAYARRFGIALESAELHAKALEWSVTRGARSGRVAWQFILDTAGRTGRALEL